MAVANAFEKMQAHEEVGASDPILSNMAREDKIPWYKKPNLRLLYFMMFPTCMGIEITSGFDSQMLNAIQAVPYWKKYFHDPTGSRKGIITASYPLGAVVSIPFVPIINDKLGRKWTIMLGSCIMCIGAIVQCFSNGTGMYIGSRIILGFGIPMCIVAGSALIGELGYPKERPALTSLFNASYFVGAILGAGVCFGTNNIQSDWAWRTPAIMQIAPSVLQLSLCLFLPESPRWLVAKDRHEEALEVLIKYHAEGDRDSDFVRAEMAQIRSTVSIEMEDAKRNWVDVARTKAMRKRLLITVMLGLFTQFSGNTLISYYLSDILDMIGRKDSIFKQKINLSISCWNLVNATILALCVLRFRRRVMFMACVIALLVCYICWTAALAMAQEGNKSKKRNQAAEIATIAIIYMYHPCYNIGYNALSYTYLIELWPYAERARGITVFQLFGRLATFFSLYVNPIALDAIGWKYLLVYVCWLLWENVFVYFFFPETFGRTLEELSFLFEDRALADRAVAAVEKAIHHEDNSIQDMERTELAETGGKRA